MRWFTLFFSDVTCLPYSVSQLLRRASAQSNLWIKPPVPEPIPVVLDGPVVRGTFLQFNVCQRHLDFLRPSASAADQTELLVLGVLIGMKEGDHCDRRDELSIARDVLGVLGLKWERQSLLKLISSQRQVDWANA